MASLFGELQRRNVIRVAIVYVVVGWVVLQVAEIIAPIMNLPDWTVPMVLFIVMVGFPFAMIFAWAFELTPEGLKRTEDVHPEESVSGTTGQTLNRAIIGLMAIAIVLLLADRLLLNSAPEEISTEIAAELEADNAEASSVDKPKSIAVLPFVNMSDDPKQEYFSDGISEELLNALAKISELHVVARTSSFFFKGKNQDITEIGNTLNVDTILEGSVRKSGNRLRIAAQLINVEDGYHLWSDTYDRELTDIFAIQDEISAAIVAALQVHLTGIDVSLDTRPANVEAYNFVLLGRESARQRTRQSLELAQKQYQRALEIDPDYAEAWAGKALASLLLSDQNYGTTPMVEAHRQSQAMLDKALSLSPDLGLAHATQALLSKDNQEPFAALESINRAIQATPSEGILYSWKSSTLDDLGRFNESTEALETGFRIDPLHWVLRSNFKLRLAVSGDYRQARELVVPDSADAYALEAQIALLNGHYADAVGYMKKKLQSAEDGGNNSDQFRLAYVYLMLLRNPEMAMQSVSAPVAMLFQAYIDPAAGYPMLINLPAEHQNNLTRGALNFVLVRTGRCDELLQLWADRSYLEKPLYGNPGDDGSPVAQATIFAYCLRQQGREAEAHLLAQRIKEYIEGAVANGQPPNYFKLLARVQGVLGEDDEALASLQLAWQYHDLNWLLLEGPFTELLHEREEFRELQAEMLDHTNAERAKLGWEPVAP